MRESFSNPSFGECKYWMNHRLRLSISISIEQKFANRFAKLHSNEIPSTTSLGNFSP